MAVYTWLLALLTKLLAASPFPPWLQAVVLNAIELAFTPAALQALEDEARALACAELAKIAAANPGSLITAEVIAELEALIGCPPASTPATKSA